jgi:hypothetical protein
MSEAFTIERVVHFRRRGHGARREIATGPALERPVLEPGRVPRLARLMALALRFEQLIHSGQVADYAELAELGHVTRARVTQIMNLRLLAPDIQEQILFLPKTLHGRDPIHLQQLQPIALVWDWNRQRRLWRELQRRQAS